MHAHTASNAPSEVVPTTLAAMYAIYQPRIDLTIRKLNRSLPEDRQNEIVQEVWTTLFENDVLGKYLRSIQQEGHEGKTFWSYLQRAACNISWLLQRSRKRHELDDKLRFDTRSTDRDDVGSWEQVVVNRDAEARMDAQVTLSMVRRVISTVLRKSVDNDRFYVLLAEGYTIRTALAELGVHPERITTVAQAIEASLEDARTDL